MDDPAIFQAGTEAEYKHRCDCEIMCARHAAAHELYEKLRNLLDKTDCNDWNHAEVYSSKNLLARIDGKEEPYPMTDSKKE